MSNLSASQIYALSRQAGFDPVSAVTATAIALAESNGNPSDVGDVNNPAKGAKSVGLWQINYSPLMQPDPTRDPTSNLDPLTNAKAAYSISNGGKNWAPWTTFTNGTYLKFLTTAAKVAPTSAGATAIKQAPAAPGGPSFLSDVKSSVIDSFKKGILGIIFPEAAAVSDVAGVAQIPGVNNQLKKVPGVSGVETAASVLSGGTAGITGTIFVGIFVIAGLGLVIHGIVKGTGAGDQIESISKALPAAAL